MRAPTELAALLMLGCASDRNGDPTVYLGAFAFNAANLEPVVIKDCLPMALIDSKNALNSTVAEFEGGFGMRCEKQGENFTYACLNEERGIIARVDVWKSLSDCKAYPHEFTRDTKTLLNR